MGEFGAGLIVAGVIIGLLLKACGKHEQACNNLKEGGKKAALWWFSKK